MTATFEQVVEMVRQFPTEQQEMLAEFAVGISKRGGVKLHVMLKNPWRPFPVANLNLNRHKR